MYQYIYLSVCVFICLSFSRLFFSFSNISFILSLSFSSPLTVSIYLCISLRWRKVSCVSITQHSRNYNV